MEVKKLYLSNGSQIYFDILLLFPQEMKLWMLFRLIWMRFYQMTPPESLQVIYIDKGYSCLAQHNAEYHI